MSRCRLSLLFLTAGFLASAAALPSFSAEGTIPNFNPDGKTAWAGDRRTSDDFLTNDKTGPGPVQSDPAHPYTPNAAGAEQPAYRIADVSNPILQPWAAAILKANNDKVRAGGVPFSARERCFPAGVPEFDIYARGEPVTFIQTKDEILLVNQMYNTTRRIYLNVPHSANPKPSWYGESVGHYEGDTLVVDTIGMNDKTFVDNYGTPHTTRLHVIERFRMINGGKTLEAIIRVDDPGAFTTPWTARQTWRWTDNGPLPEYLCEANNESFYGYDVVPMPHADKPEF